MQSQFGKYAVKGEIKPFVYDNNLLTMRYGSSQSLERWMKKKQPT